MTDVRAVAPPGGERQAFEQWARAQWGLPRSRWPDNAWLGWQARAALSDGDARDAARYRWLCANNFDGIGVTQVHTWLQTWEPHSQTGEPTEWTQRVRGGRLDAVIDAAMAPEVDRSMGASATAQTASEDQSNV